MRFTRIDPRGHGPGKPGTGMLIVRAAMMARRPRKRGSREDAAPGGDAAFLFAGVEKRWVLWICQFR